MPSKTREAITGLAKGKGGMAKGFSRHFVGETVGVVVGLPLAGFAGRLVESALVRDETDLGNKIYGWAANTGTKAAGYFFLKWLKGQVGGYTGLLGDIINGAHLAMAGSIAIDTTLRVSGCDKRSLLTMKNGNEPPKLRSDMRSDNQNVEGGSQWIPLTERQIQEINNKLKAF